MRDCAWSSSGVRRTDPLLQGDGGEAQAQQHGGEDGPRGDTLRSIAGACRGACILERSGPMHWACGRSRQRFPLVLRSGAILTTVAYAATAVAHSNRSRSGIQASLELIGAAQAV